jgi:hypothetical protein
MPIINEQIAYITVLEPAPVITTPPTANTLNILSAYEPIIFDLTWATDSKPWIVGKYITCDVYYGATPVLLGIQQKTAINVNGNLVYRFDLSEMLKTILNAQFFKDISTDQINTGQEKILNRFYCDFRGNYVSQLRDRAERTALVRSSTYYVSNFIIQHDQAAKVLLPSVSSYIIGGVNQRFLTKSPDNKPLQKFETEQLSFFYNGTNSLQIGVQTYQLNGTPNSEAYKSAVTVTNRNGTITLSPSDLTSTFDNISKIDVWLRDSVTLNRLTRKQTFVMDRCTQGLRLVWLNQFGGVDKFTFKNYQLIETMVSDRVRYTKPLKAVSIPEDFRGKELSRKAVKRYRAVSDILTDDYLDLIEDLILSSEVYLEENTNIWKPVLVNTNSQIIRVSEGLIQCEIDFELSAQIKTHIG